MTPEEAIQVADEVLLAHAGNPLTDIQRLILRESLAGKGYERMEGYAPQQHLEIACKIRDFQREEQATELDIPLAEECRKLKEELEKMREEGG